MEGAQGDANLRSFMDWDALESGAYTGEVLEHWRKLGRFRHAHPAVGAGEHQRLRADPYIFSRALETAGRSDRVLVAMDLGGRRQDDLPVRPVPRRSELIDAYSGETGTVTNGEIALDDGVRSRAAGRGGDR